MAATFTPIRSSNPDRKSANDPPRNVTARVSASADIPSTRLSICSSQSRSSGFDGANVNPQLPVSTVVTPCQEDGDAVGSKWSWAS